MKTQNLCFHTGPQQLRMALILSVSLFRFVFYIPRFTVLFRFCVRFAPRKKSISIFYHFYVPKTHTNSKKHRKKIVKTILLILLVLAVLGAAQVFSKSLYFFLLSIRLQLFFQLSIAIKSHA